MARQPRAANGSASRLRISSFRSHLQTELVQPPTLDPDADPSSEPGLLMAVANPAQNQIYAEDEEADSEGEEDWSDAPDGADDLGAITPELPESGSGVESEGETPADMFCSPMPPVPMELEEEAHIPVRDEAIEDRPPTPPRIQVRVPMSPMIPFSSPPRTSTASEPATRRRSLDVLPLPPGRLSADAATGMLEPSPSMVSAHREERQRRRQSLDPRAASRISGIFNFIRRDRSSDGHVSPPPQLPAPRRRPSRSPPPSANSTLSDIPPIAPPPSLPAPTLAELGLSLKPLTPALTPGHMPVPPTSGCLLSPGYLLLCHTDGLDVVPLYAPPAARSYALIRGVPFRSVLVMESLGFLVAIAGRREGVRVYALADVKRAIEARMDIERERERAKRKTVVVERSRDNTLDMRVNGGGRADAYANLTRKVTPRAESTGDARADAYSKLTKASPRAEIAPGSMRSASLKVTPTHSPLGTPNSAVHSRSSHRPHLQVMTSNTSLSSRYHAHAASSGQPRTLRNSSSAVSIVGTGARRLSGTGREVEEKGEWMEGGAEDTESDSEGFAMLAGPSSATGFLEPSPVVRTAPREGGRRRRPANLNLEPREPTAIFVSDGMPSPAPTLLTMRQALAASPTASIHSTPSVTPTGHEVITFADALMESRLPGLPPPGTRWPQTAQFSRNGTTGAVTVTSSEPPQTAPMLEPVRSSAEAARSAQHLPIATPSTHSANNRRRRWSVLDGLFNGSPPPSPQFSPPEMSFMPASIPAIEAAQVPSSRPTTSLVPRIITTAFKSRNNSQDSSKKVKTPSGHPPPHYHAPIKLEHIKLDGTRGALLIKAVQTARKSFLAILCGEDGKKVELFTGSARTASLSLARTFILPDSPLSLELQVQGEDLAEIFLIFADSVFALEPASVRVRQVNIARAERRAARRRRERERGGADPVAEPMSPTSPVARTTRSEHTVQESGSDPPRDRSQRRRERSHTSDVPAEVQEDGRRQPSRPGRPEEKPSPQLPSFTTFQQLSFSPTFPLGTLAEDWIIPPTYPAFVKHKEWLDTQSISGALDRFPADPIELWYTLSKTWPAKGVLREGLLKSSLGNAGIPLEDYFLPPISVLAQPAHFGPPALFFCSRGGLSTAIVDHKGKPVLNDKFRWSPQSFLRHTALGDIQRVEAFDGINEGAVLIAIRQSGLEALDVGDALLSPAPNSISSTTPASISRRHNWIWEVGDPLPGVTASSSSYSPAKPFTNFGKANGLLGNNSQMVNGGGKHDSALWSGDLRPFSKSIFFLGREANRIYLCIRGAGTFRILLLQSSL